MAKRHLGIVGAAFLALGVTGTAQAGVQEGVASWGNGDYAAAVAEWQPLADAGDPDAQFNLGQAYKLGRGVPQDMGRAQQLFRAASDQGHLRAEANYGIMLFQDGNREQAMPYIARAANRGEARAQYIYGTALFNGDLAPRDWPQAYAMMTNAAQAGLPQATASLQQMDQYIPIEDRESGLEMARSMSASQADVPTQVAAAPPPPSVPPVRTPPPRVTPVPTPVPAAPRVTPPPASPAATVSRPTASAPPPPVFTPAPPATTPTAPVARSGDWRIQLGSFRQRSGAESHWRNVSGRIAELRGLQPYLVTAGPYTRLQAGPFQTQSAANTACSAARRGGSDCIAARRP